MEEHVLAGMKLTPVREKIVTRNGAVRFTRHVGLTLSHRFIFITFEYKGFDIRKRDAQSFYDDFSICPPPSRAAPVAQKFVWSQRTPKVNPSRSESSSQLNWLSSKSSKSSARASGAWRHSHSQVTIFLSGISILRSVNVTSSQHAR